MDLIEILKIKKFSKEEAEKWLRDIGLAVTGNKDELINRIIKYKRYPKLKLKAKRNSSFKCSLDPLSISSPNARCFKDDKNYPAVTKSSYFPYASNKKEGSQGQQEKALLFLLNI